ncbi:MAG: hypothetical protein Q8O75_03885 [bacterium]|nr:hypothetical protein [bacterium]
MSKNNSQHLAKDKTNQYIVIGLTLFSVFLAFLFWRSPLTVYDAAGHVSLVRTIASDFWPKFSGWSGSELLGWPTGVFYPSLFHWLAAGLSFLIGVPAAIKLLISAAIVTLPLSIYTYARSLTEDKFWASSLTLVLFLLLLLFPNFLGTGFRSLFQIGLLSNFFVLPFLFLFLATLHKQSSYLLSALLLSTIVLTHIVAAIAAVVYLVLLIKVKFLSRRLTGAAPVNYLKMLVLTAFLTAFFWIPFLLNIEYTSVSRHVSSYFLPNIAVFILSTLVGFYAWRKKEENTFILSMFSAFIAFVAAVDAFLIRSYGTSFILYQFHIYRFQPFAYLLLATALILFGSKYVRLDKWGFTKTGTLFGGLGLITLLLLVRNPAAIPDTKLAITDPQGVKGRFLETFRRTQSDPFWYFLQTQLSSADKKAFWAYGLFTDSTPNGPYLGSLIRSLSPDLYPEGEGNFLEEKIIGEEKAGWLLSYFSINQLINLERNEGKSIGKIEKGKEILYFNVEKAAETGAFEIAQLPLKPIEKNWEKEVESWWLAAGKMEELPYFAKKGKIKSVHTGSGQNVQIVVIRANRQQTRFKLKINSNKAVPILAKISYFPYWHAYQGGKEIPIYRAAPNLMLFEAKGKVELVYKEPVWVNWLYIVSGITWLIAILVVIQMTNVKSRMSNEAQNPKSKKG